MKKILIALIIILILPVLAYARVTIYNTPLQGESIASNYLQYKVLKKIYKQAVKSIKSCNNFQIVNTQIIHYPYDTKKDKNNDKYVSGYWQELWTLNACSEVIQIPITFYIFKNKTQFVLDKKCGLYN